MECKDHLSKFYFKLIEHRKQNIPSGYVESHHIVPKSLGGTDERSNLVKLTAREHFICHLLLVRMLSGEDRKKMLFAAHNMMFWKSGDNQRSHKISSKIYQLLKEQISIARKGRLSDDLRARYTPERMKNTWAHIWRRYKIVFPSGETHVVTNLSKWCKDEGHSLTTLRKALANGGTVLSSSKLNKRGRGCRPSKLDGVMITYE